MPHANSSGVSIYYEVHGQSDSPLIMISGMTASIVDWVPARIESLSTKHQVVVFDNRGVGQSGKPTTSYTMADCAADTVRVLDHLGLDQAHVFGGSMGGMIAQHVYLNHPERVKSLILFSTSAAFAGHPEFVRVPQEVLEQQNVSFTGDRVADAWANWNMVFGSEFVESNHEMFEDLLQAKLAYPETTELSKNLQRDALIESHDAIERLDQIKCPTLIQVGLKDLLLPPANSHILAQRIQNAKLIEYEKLGHDLLTEGGDEVIGDILDFIDEVESSM